MAESSNFVQPAIPKFDGYYEHWAMLMENLLRSKEYWGLIENGINTAPANATPEQRRVAEESKLRDLKIKNYLFQSIDRSILETILVRDTARDIWEAMRRKYQGSTKVKRAQLQSLRREFEVLAMGENETVNDYFARTLAIANKMTSHEESNDVTTLSIDELQSSLLVHEGRMKGQKDLGDEQALKVAGADKGNGRGRGRNSSRGRGRGRQSKETVQCYKCHKFGHYQNECPEWENAKYAEIYDEEEMLLMADSNSKCNNSKEEIWYLDSGCSNHMIDTKEWMHDFDDSFTESVKLGNDSKMAVMGKGNIKLNIGGKISANRMYMIFAPVSKVDESYLWHHRYAHLNMKGLKTLNQKQMVKGLPEVKDIENKCVDCLTGKQHRDNIPKKANWRASQKLELVHSDICGPIKPESNGGNRYFITFTDDLTRKTWSYYLQEKSDAFDVFKSTQGIKRQLIVAYTAQQNGVSERKNRTILNMVRSMVSARGVPKRFWPEAVNWATYVMNRSPTFAVQDMTPEEAWSGVKPSVHHFRVFGCLAHVHIPDRKIIVSRDVVFEELKGWDWGSKGTNSSKNQVIDIDESVATQEHQDVNDAVNEANDADEAQEAVIPDSDDDSSEELPARTRHPPGYLIDYVNDLEVGGDLVQNFALFSSNEDPESYDEAIKHEVWRKAMQSEIESIKSNDTWELTELPLGVKPIGVKWIYKTKYNEEGKIEKHKARLVAKGYAQRHGIGYSEVFAPVARWDTIRTILSLAATKNWSVFQLDVKSAFLHGELVEDVYVNQSLGFQTEDKNQVYKLNKIIRFNLLYDVLYGVI
ncbi:copia-type polyprotein [Trifolium medium]|uniref:Copia-type polyprotein n=1 Tax=Trifolium medium TaxID=97028 RepID=A0A392LYF4_9FABA|nr:copia-type polyprotein [Trifolium medium]